MSNPGSPTPGTPSQSGAVPPHATGDANPLTEVGQLASVLIVAAQSAASAASAQQVLSQQLVSQFATTATTTSSPSSLPSAASKFANASKMVRMPDPFTAVGPEAEQSSWADFELNLLAWLGAADPEFETDLQWISEHVNQEFDMDVHSDDMVARSRELHSILVGLLRNRSLKVLRGVPGRNGYEVFRQLLKVFKRSTKPWPCFLL